MKICPKCNKEQEEGTVCLICGEKLVEKNDIVETNHTKKSDNNFYNRVPESSKPSSAKFVIILLIIFICFALAFVIISRRAQTVNPLISTKDIEKQIDNFTNSFGSFLNSDNNTASEEEAQENINIAENEEYILANSNVDYLTETDITGLTLQEINYAKNEIYARHGRRFESQELMNYFTSKSWYEGIYDPDDFDANYSDDVLNDYEKKNAEFLRSVEYSMNPNGYELDR